MQRALSLGHLHRRQLWRRFSARRDFEFGNYTSGHQEIAADRSKFFGSVLKRGGSIELPVRFRVSDGQTRAHVSAQLLGAQSIKVSKDRLESDKPALGSRTTVRNQGKSNTPGPIEGSFRLYYPQGGGSPIYWNEKTRGPISAGGTATIDAIKSISQPLLKEFLVDAGVLLLCPDGSSGSLSDGNRENNRRTLKQQ
jgi:hypothetical protein